MNSQTQRQPPDELNDFAFWYKGIPICTRVLLTSFIFFTVLGNFIVNPVYLFYFPRITFGGLQIWRLYTSFFFHPFNLAGAIQAYFIYTYSKDLETAKFLGITADYVFFLLFEALIMLIIGGFTGRFLFNQSLVMAIIYIWAQLYRDAIVNFMFGIRFKGVFLPFVFLLVESLQMQGAIPWGSVLGVVTGHLYYYLQEIYPANGGARLLNTPQWLYYWFPPNTSDGGIRASFGTVLNAGDRVDRVQQGSTDGTRQRYTWGRGHRLGT